MGSFAIRVAKDGCWELLGKGMPFAVETPDGLRLLDSEGFSDDAIPIMHVGPPEEAHLRNLARWINHQADHLRDGKAMGVDFEDCEITELQP